MDAAFILRPLTRHDEAFLWDMLYLAIHVPDGQALPPRAILKEPSLAHYVDHWGQLPGDLGCIALEQVTARPVGAAWLRLFSAEDKGYGYLDDLTPELSIAMLPEYRGQGVGGLLLDALFVAARPVFSAVSLSVSPDNPALRLYQRVGFEVVSGTGDSLTMLKRLR